MGYMKHATPFHNRFAVLSIILKVEETYDNWYITENFVANTSSNEFEAIELLLTAEFGIVCLNLKLI